MKNSICDILRDVFLDKINKRGYKHEVFIFVSPTIQGSNFELFMLGKMKLHQTNWKSSKYESSKV